MEDSRGHVSTLSARVTGAICLFFVGQAPVIYLAYTLGMNLETLPKSFSSPDCDNVWSASQADSPVLWVISLGGVGVTVCILHCVATEGSQSRVTGCYGREISSTAQVGMAAFGFLKRFWSIWPAGWALRDRFLFVEHVKNRLRTHTTVAHINWLATLLESATA